MMGRIICYLLCIQLSAILTSGHLLETRLGKLEGVKLPARYNKTYIAYFGVPFAEQPVGDLRFKPPVEAGKWNGTFDATHRPKACPQIPKSETVYGGYEDCLYVNVYTPENARAGSNIPVMLHLYGGMFRRNNVTYYGPQYFMGREIIIVAPSSRIGVLGYLSTGDSVVSGNMGMKDLVLAMKWTKENIYDYGGDPNRITLSGHSSGAVSAHLLTMSHQSKDYFHRAILQSGLGVAPQMIMGRDTARKLAQLLAQQVNCSVAPSEVLVACLMTKTAEELVMAGSKLTIWQGEPGTIFRPTVEDKSVENAFMTENPLLAPYASMEKPWLVGMTSSEAANYVSDNFQNSDTYGTHVNLILPIWGLFSMNTKPNHVQFIQQIIKSKFLDNQDKLTHSTDLAIVEVLTAIMHGMGLLDVIQKYRGTKYLYLYDYRAGYNQADIFRGVGHADEVNLMWLQPKSNLNPLDLPFGDEMITRWVNFVYSGDPNIPFPINRTMFGDWHPVSSSHFEFLHIRVNGSMNANYFEQRFGFWKKLPFFSNFYDN